MPRRSPPARSEDTGSGAPPAVTLAARLRRARLQSALSIRQLAEKAGVDKGTLVKLEHGSTPSYRTLVRVCDALGVSVVHLLQSRAEEDVVSVHRRANERREPRKGQPNVQVRNASRQELVAADRGALLTWLDCRRPGGVLNSWLLEVRDPTEPTTHPGEEFVFCLRGRAALTVSNVRYELDTGDAASFWSAEPHFYGPANPLRYSDPSVLLLSVWVHDRDLGARRITAKQKRTSGTLDHAPARPKKKPAANRRGGSR